MSIVRWFGRGVGRAFLRDRRGNVAMMWGLMGTVLIGLVGVTVDFTRAQALRVQMQNAADGAALVAERNSNRPLSERQDLAFAFFQAEMGAESASRASFTVIEQADGGHRVEVSMPMALSLAALVRNEDWVIGVNSEAMANASPPIEVALVLDNTGSMRNDMDTLRDAASDLADFLLSIDGDTVSVALVPFVAQVNIGNDAAHLAWMDVAGLNPHHGEFLEDRPLARRSAGGTGNCTLLSPVMVGSPYLINWVKEGSRCVAYNPSQINIFTLLANLPASVRGWSGCVESRPPPYDITDDPPSLTTPATMFVPYFWVDEGDDDTYNNNWLNEPSTIIPGASNLTGGATFSVFKYTPTASLSLSFSAPSMRGPQRGCPTPIVPLTTDRTQLMNAIAAMRDWNGGGTNQAEGLAWGWRVLSPGAPFTQGRPYNDPSDPVRKVLVLMTDGENTSLNNGNDAFTSDYSSYQYRSLWTTYQYETTPSSGEPGIPSQWRRSGISGSSSMVSYINSREEALCDAIKNAGIEIYTIQFRDTSTSNRDRLRNCSSPPHDEHFFAAANAQELQNAFDAIGSGIGALRLTH